MSALNFDIPVDEMTEPTDLPDTDVSSVEGAEPDDIAPDPESLQAHDEADQSAEASNEDVEADDEEAEAPKPSRAQARIQGLVSDNKTLKQQIAMMEQRFAAFQEAIARNQQQSMAPKEPEVPDYEDDPGGHLLAQIGQLRANQEATQRTAAEQQAAQQYQQHWMQFAQQFNAAEEALAKTSAPDYYDAIQWLRDQRVNQYQALGYTPEQALQVVNHEAQTQAVEMARRGMNGAEGFYNLAKAAGWKGKVAPATEQVERLSQNVRRSQSLGTRGRTGKDRVTLADLANMSEADFAKATEGDKWAELWQ